MTRTYMVKSIFGPTIQGEGSMVGTPCVFVRFAGCNMWDGRPETRAASACPYCDTDFFGGEKMTAVQIAQSAAFTSGSSSILDVVLSGGEPLLQVDQKLVDELIRAGLRVHVETNGTRELPFADDGSVHVSMSPKVPRDQIRLARADDVKVLWPHPDPRITPQAFESFPARHRFLQPIGTDDGVIEANVASAIRELGRLDGIPRWRLSMQVHKLVGVP